MKYNIDFPDGFFNEEVRDGFLVDSNKKKIWACLLDLYSELRRVCDKYGIVIYAGGVLCLVRYGMEDSFLGMMTLMCP